MAIDKLTPKYLKKDEDHRLIKAMEMIDALNVRVSADEEGNEGVLKNIKGNTEIEFTLPIGSNKTIGSAYSDKTKDILSLTTRIIIKNFKHTKILLKL